MKEFKVMLPHPTSPPAHDRVQADTVEIVHGALILYRESMNSVFDTRCGEVVKAYAPGRWVCVEPA